LIYDVAHGCEILTSTIFFG